RRATQNSFDIDGTAFNLVVILKIENGRLIGQQGDTGAGSMFGYWGAVDLLQIGGMHVLQLGIQSRQVNIIREKISHQQLVRGRLIDDLIRWEEKTLTLLVNQDGRAACHSFLIGELPHQSIGANPK